MKKSEMDAEPEVTMTTRGGNKGDANMRWDPDVDGSDDAGEMGGLDDGEENEGDEQLPTNEDLPSPSAELKPKKAKDKSKKKRDKAVVPPPVEENLTLKGDDFFDSD